MNSIDIKETSMRTSYETPGLLESLRAAQEREQEPLNSEQQRALQMAALFAGGAFSRAEARVHVLLTWWVIRGKLGQAVKRAIDITGSLLALLLFSPVIAATAVAIKLDSPGPIFYRQQRVGKWGRTFDCFKFRSMFVDADRRKAELMAQNEADAVVFKMKNDPRVTRVGRFIRKFSVDELPQLVNVLRGDMSLVGPRPPVPLEVAQYAYDQYRRLDAVPGITGLQQVSGRSQLSFKRWVELDVQYIEQQSLLEDIKILLRTIPAVITTRGAY